MGRPSKSEQQARRAAEAARHAGNQRHKESVLPSSPGGHTVVPSGTATAPTPPPLYDPLLTIEQVSDWLGKPKNTLYAWRTRGLGPQCIKVGNSLRYRRSAVEAYLEANTFRARGA
jgi:predicted DNA-binding transcriptional regulator AlpA